MEYKGNIFIGNKELKRQVEEYDTLTNIRTYRGQAAGLLVFSLVITIVLAAPSLWPMEDLYAAIIFYAPLVYFVEKGRSWALVAGMIILTIDKGYQLITTPSSAAILIFWWVLFMRYFYGAWTVERVRKKLATIPVEENREAA